MRASEQEGTVKFVSGKRYELWLASKPERTVRAASLRGSKIAKQDVELFRTKANEQETRWIGCVDVDAFDPKVKSVRDEWVFTVHLSGCGTIELPLHVKLYTQPRARGPRRGSMLGSITYLISTTEDKVVALDRRFLATTTTMTGQLHHRRPSHDRLVVDEAEEQAL